MAYSLCASCGAKTLVGATRCPRCQTPLVSYASDAKRPETVRCPNCGVLRPLAIGVCPNCHAGPETPNRRSARGLMIAAGVVVLILVVGFVITKMIGPAEPVATVAMDTTASPTSAPPSDMPAAMPTAMDSVPQSRTDTAARAVSVTVSTPAAASTTAPAKTPPSAPAAAASAAPPVAPNPTPASPTMTAGAPPATPAKLLGDTAWSYWRATTWVRLRDKPGRNGEEVRMIDSAQRVLLGPSANGWRSARVGSDRGWVDPRLFVPATRP